MKRTTIRLPEELLRKAKSKALAEGRTLTSLVEEGLHLVLSPRTKAIRKRIRLPVSKAKGGLQEGVDLSESGLILDLMESE